MKHRRKIVRGLRWALPLVVSGVVSAFTVWGSAQYAKGTDAQRLTTVERDVTQVRADIEKARGEHDDFVRRDAFQIVLDDLKEIKSDVRTIRDRAGEDADAPTNERRRRGITRP